MIKLPSKTCGIAFPDLSAQLITDPWQDDRPRISVIASRTEGRQTVSNSLVIDDADKAIELAEQITAAALLLKQVEANGA